MRHSSLRRLRRLAAVCLMIAAAAPARADEALVAVAANFAHAAEALESAFEAASEHEVTIATGSTGQLYAQIVHGAPFDVFLAADAERPRLLERSGAAAAGTRFTYAVGRLALWSPDPGRIPADGAEALRADIRRLAIANPDIAPYGAAAMETLRALGLDDALAPELVRAENIGQAYALTATGNAELGIVALSSVLSSRTGPEGSYWCVPSDLYAPIRQDAVLLARADADPAARAFLAFLKTDAARAIIESYGYGTE